MTEKAYYLSKQAEYYALPDVLEIVSSTHGPVLSCEVSSPEEAIPWDYNFILLDGYSVLIDLKLCSRAEEFRSIPLHTALEGLSGLVASPRVHLLLFLGSFFVYITNSQGLAQIISQARQEERNFLPLKDIFLCATKVLPAREETSRVLRNFYWKILHS